MCSVIFAIAPSKPRPASTLTAQVRPDPLAPGARLDVHEVVRCEEAGGAQGDGEEQAGRRPRHRAEHHTEHRAADGQDALGGQEARRRHPAAETGAEQLERDAFHARAGIDLEHPLRHRLTHGLHRPLTEALGVHRRGDPHEAVARGAVHGPLPLAGGEGCDLADQVDRAGEAEEREKEQEHRSGHPLNETIFLSRSEPMPIIVKPRNISLWPVEL
jgi:hypothetical protein